MPNTNPVLGTVVSLWRYPVKSMQGEELNAAEATERGLLGDRAYALVDAGDGMVASAKNPSKWPNLFDFRAAFAEPPRKGGPLPPVRITFPNGTLIRSDQQDADPALTTVVGRPAALRGAAPERPVLEEYWPDMEELPHRDTVTDERMPGGLFFDAAPVHLLTTATIDRLRELYPQGRFEVRRFRPNVVVAPAAGGPGFVENQWIGRTLVLGGEVRVEVTGPCPRCVMTTLAQADLPKDPGILRTAARHNQAHVGVYARVVHRGLVRRGDLVWLE
jgi:uncharacterized protein YcbX